MRVVLAGILAGLFTLLAAGTAGTYEGKDSRWASFGLRLFFFLVALVFYSYATGAGN